MRSIPLLLVLACRPPGPEVVSVEALGPAPQSDDIVGRDGGSSARAFGRSVWVFGDTVLAREDALGRTWHHNSVSFTDDVDGSDGIDAFEEPLDPAGLPRHLIPPSPEELAFNDAHRGDDCAEEPCGARWAVWPGAPVWDAERARALVFYGLIYAEPGPFQFEGVGQSLAVWTDPDGDPVRPVIDPDAEHPDLLWGPGEGAWGAAAVLHDDHILALGCDQGGLGHSCQLARAPLDDVLSRAAWRYWDGRRWSTEREDAADLFEGAPILSWSWNAALDAWLVIYSPPFSREIRARTAPAPEGPWSAASVVHRVAGEDAPYDVVHHAELEQEDGLVQVLTWSRPTGGWFDTEMPVLRVVFDGSP